MYPQSMFRAKIRKIRKIFKKNNLRMNIFTAVKYCGILACFHNALSRDYTLVSDYILEKNLKTDLRMFFIPF